jgi:hypothetical protein
MIGNLNERGVSKIQKEIDGEKVLDRSKVVMEVAGFENGRLGNI